MTTQENMLARHRVLHELGRGATGAVYAARDRATGTVVALKRLDPALAQSDAKLGERFLERARSARRLNHPNIVRVYEAGQAAGTTYVAMEMLEGDTLRRILDQGPLPLTRAVRIAHEVASGLAHAHLEGVIHGGLKPSNIIVSPSGLVKVTDFGVAQPDPATRDSPAAAGGLAYLSPEQLRGDPVDHRSDIFALGAVFYEMLAGRRPFEGDTAQALLENMLRVPPPRPSELNPNVPRALDTVVLGMLVPQSAARLPGAPILLRDLKRIEEGLGLQPIASAAVEAPKAEAPRAPEPPPEPDPMRTEPRFAPQEQFHLAGREVFDYQRALLEREERAREHRRERSSRSGPVVFAALALIFTLLGIVLAGFLGADNPGNVRQLVQDWSSRIDRAITAARTPPASAKEPPPIVAAAPGTEAPVAEPPKAEPPAPQPPPPPPALVAKPEPPAAEVEPPAEPAPAPTKKATAKIVEARPAGTAKLIVAVSPGGELYINGEHRGTTPPTTTFELEPGMHRIEVRNGSRKPYLTYMTVQPGDVRRIRHDFNAKPLRPPG